MSIPFFHDEYPSMHAGAHRKPPAKIGAPGLCRQVGFWISRNASLSDGGRHVPEGTSAHPVRDGNGVIPFRERRGWWIEAIDNFLYNMIRHVSFEIDTTFSSDLKNRTYNHYAAENIYLFRSTMIGSPNGWTRHPIFTEPGQTINGVTYDPGVDILVNQMPSRHESVTFTFIWRGLPTTVQASLHNEYFSLSTYIDLSDGLMDLKTFEGLPREDTELLERISSSIKKIDAVSGARFDKIKNNKKWGNWARETMDDHKELRTLHETLYEQVWRDFEVEIVNPSYRFGSRSGELEAKIGSRFFDARAVILHCPPDERVFCNLPFSKNARTPLESRLALGDFFTGQEDHSNPTNAVNHVDAVLPFMFSGKLNEDTRIEYTATRFLRRRVIYVSSLAAEQSGFPRELNNPIKFLLLSRLNQRWQLGRLVERVFAMGTVRVAALMNLSNLNDAGNELRELARELQEDRIKISSGSMSGEALKQRHLDHVTRTAELGRGCEGGIEYRIERSRYYVQQYEQILSDFAINNAEALIEGFQRYDVFVRRKLRSSYDFINLLGIRLQRHNEGLQALGQAVQIHQHFAVSAAIEEGDREREDIQSRLLSLQFVGEFLLIIPFAYYTGRVIRDVKRTFPSLDFSFGVTDVHAWPFVYALVFWAFILGWQSIRHWREWKRLKTKLDARQGK